MNMPRYLLLIYFAIYVAVAFVAPTYRVWKRTGINPVTFGRSGNAHDYIGQLFRLAMIGLSLVIVIHAFFPEVYRFLLPIFWLEHPVYQLAGVVLLILSFLWTVAAQIQMGNSWRIGIDQETKPELVSSGLFGISRNPIFLGMIVTLLGLLLALPNALTLLAFGLGYALIQIQVRLEEEFLASTRGEEYNAYMRRVRRWL